MKITVCRDCKQEIGFKQLESGKWMPHNPETITADHALAEFGQKASLLIVDADDNWGIYGSKRLKELGDVEGLVPHWLTCPHAENFRRERTQQR